MPPKILQREEMDSAQFVAGDDPLIGGGRSPSVDPWALLIAWAMSCWLVSFLGIDVFDEECAELLELFDDG